MKLFFARRLASCIVQYCIENKINVCCLEDLKSKYGDDNNNRLTHLFTPTTLIKCIKSALEKNGIGYLEVNKDGTSQIDPLTGFQGCRNGKNKSMLYVIRNGVVGWINSDLAASTNVLLRGLNRSIVPYSFYIKKDNDEPSSRKRLKKFFKFKFGNEKINLEKHGEELRISDKKSKYNGIVYYCSGSGKMYTKVGREIEKNEIMNLVAFSKEIKEFDVIPSGEIGCKNFTSDKVLESSQVVTRNKVTIEEIDFAAK